MLVRRVGIWGLIVVGLMVWTTPAPADAGQVRPLIGKHRFDLSAGLLSEVRVSTNVTWDGVTTETTDNGVLATLSYTHYLNNDVGVSVAAGFLDADARTYAGTGGTVVESASVTALLFGIKYQPERLAVGRLRPYGTIATGPYFGTASNVRTGFSTNTESISEAEAGARIGVGLDVFLGRFIALGFGAGYNFVSEFDTRIGSESDYSGPEFSLSLGVIFGGS